MRQGLMLEQAPFHVCFADAQAVLEQEVQLWQQSAQRGCSNKANTQMRLVI